jgi:hypothetical protein
MTALTLSQAEEATGVAKITITRALKAKWHAATRKQGGSYEIDTVAPASSERRVRSLIPWRRAAEARAAPSSGNSWLWPRSDWQTSRPHSMTCGRSETHGKRWHRRAYGPRPRLPPHDGRGARPDDRGGSLSRRRARTRIVRPGRGRIKRTALPGLTRLRHRPASYVAIAKRVSAPIKPLV